MPTTRIICTALNTCIVSIYHSLSASLILAAGQGLAGDNLNDFEKEDKSRGGADEI
jgi:hypothetical protein